MCDSSLATTLDEYRGQCSHCTVVLNGSQGEDIFHITAEKLCYVCHNNQCHFEFPSSFQSSWPSLWFIQEIVVNLIYLCIARLYHPTLCTLSYQEAKGYGWSSFIPLFERESIISSTSLLEILTMIKRILAKLQMHKKVMYIILIIMRRHFCFLLGLPQRSAHLSVTCKATKPAASHRT